MTSNTTLYAKWTENTYTLTYNANGSSSGTVPNSMTVGSVTQSTVSSNGGMLVKTGYTFSGWNTAQDGTGTDYNVNSSITLLTNTTLYAKWTAIDYTYVYKDSEGNIISDNTVTYGDNVPQSPLQRLPGHRFTTWSEIFNEELQTYTLVPQFEEIEVTLDANDITPSMGNVFAAVVFSDAELANPVSVRLEFNVLDSNSINQTEKALFDALAQTAVSSSTTENLYLDINLFRKVNSMEEELISLTTALQISFVVPENFRNRFFELIRVHNGVAEVIDYTYTSSNHSVSFSTDRFSTYGLTYDASVSTQTSTNTKNNTTIVLPTVTTEKTVTISTNDSKTEGPMIKDDEEEVTDANADKETSADQPRPEEEDSTNDIPNNRNLFGYFGDIWTSTKESFELWSEISNMLY